MAQYYLSENFNYFFSRINPSNTFIQTASRQYQNIVDTIQDRNAPAAVISPQCFLQGSYRQRTAIHSINDIDVIVLCQLWYPPNPATTGGDSWNRNRIFNIIADSLRRNDNYSEKLRYNDSSMCIKLDLGIKVELLPAVFRKGNYDSNSEPFYIYRPESSSWVYGYARQHQGLLSWKNLDEKTQGNFIPAIKILKHLRSIYSIDAVSFHIECLLYSLPDNLFWGNPADYIPNILNHLAHKSASNWYFTTVTTPCGDRDIFSGTEWGFLNWSNFHSQTSTWAILANLANSATVKNTAIDYWKALLGNAYFPRDLS